MPVPWGDGPTRIPDVAKRAITVNQLQNVKIFLERLTKTELLKHTSEFTKTTGDYDKKIQWSKLNMYSITDEVIKKVIPFIDPDGKEDKQYNSGRKWYSWVEFVATEEQPAAVMFSHWWGGRFMDFMKAVAKMVTDRSMSIYEGVWICTFANCQFGEKFGSKLKECPFIKALQSVHLTVMIVDYMGGSLTRTWCGLEVNYTTNKEIDFVLYTSGGRIGSAYVSGGPLVEAVKEWDIRKSEASDPPYRRQILNYVAGVQELEGLKKDGDGEMAVDDMGRPSLEDDSVDKEMQPRINGEPEFAYESKLFRKRAKRFEDLNMAVRLRVMAGIGLSSKPKGCEVEKIEHRGVTLSQLRTLSAKLELSCPWISESENCEWYSGDEAKLEYEDLKNEHVKEWLQHMTEEEDCSYMEMVSDGPQVPHYLLPLSSSVCWKDRMTAIELFAEAQQLPDTACFFVFACAGLFLPDHGDEIGQYLETVMAEVQGIIVPLGANTDIDEAQVALGQALQIGSAKDRAKGVFFASKEGILACSQPFSGGTWVHGEFDVQVLFNLLEVLHANEDPEDADDLGSIDNEGFRLMVRVHKWAAAPVLRNAVKENDSATIRIMCSLPGMRLNGEALKDNLGRMPLHYAVACKCYDAMETLLELKCDPNVEDGMKERPLHYCAFMGATDAAKVLLKYGADPWAENGFSEAAIEVANQNPAAYLGIDTSGVKAVLSEAAQPLTHKEALDIFKSFALQKPRPVVAGSGAAAVKGRLPKP